MKNNASNFFLVMAFIACIGDIYWATLWLLAIGLYIRK